MSVRSSQSITVLFTTRVFSTGVGTNADSLPTGTLYVNGTADAASVTITNITGGVYKAAVTLPTLAVGDVVDLRVSATVSTITDSAVVWRDTKDVLLTSTGGAAIDWANVQNPTTTLALTGTTIATTQKVDLETIKTNPVVNAGTVTFPTTATLASTTNITAGTITTVTTTTTATNVTTVNGLAAGVITAASIAADAITAAKIADGAIDTATFAAGTTIPRVTLADTLTTYTGNTPQTGDAYALANSGTFGLAAIKGFVDDIGVAGAGLTALGDTRLANLDAAVSSRMATYTQPTGFLAATFPGTVASTTNITGGTITTVTTTTTATNLTNAPTAGDFTAAMKTSLNASTPASVTGAVGSVTGSVGGNVTGSVGSISGVTFPSNFATLGIDTSGRVRTDRVLFWGTLGDQSASDVDSVVLPTGPSDNGVLVGSRLRIVSGSGQFQERTVRLWNGTTKLATIDRPLQGSLQAEGDEFQVLYDDAPWVDQNGRVNSWAVVLAFETGALFQFFTTDTTKTYADAVAGSVVKEIADNASGVDLSADLAAVKAKTDNLPSSPAAVGSAMILANGAITEASITQPTEAAGRPTGLLAKLQRLFEWGSNKKTRNKTTGVVTLRNEGDTSTLESQTQSTVEPVDTQSKGV